jgi:hypothetical protein
MGIYIEKIVEVLSNMVINIIIIITIINMVIIKIIKIIIIIEKNFDSNL